MFTSTKTKNEILLMWEVINFAIKMFCITWFLKDIFVYLLSYFKYFGNTIERIDRNVAYAREFSIANIYIKNLW